MKRHWKSVLQTKVVNEHTVYQVIEPRFSSLGLKDELIAPTTSYAISLIIRFCVKPRWPLRPMDLLYFQCIVMAFISQFHLMSLKWCAITSPNILVEWRSFKLIWLKHWNAIFGYIYSSVFVLRFRHITVTNCLRSPFNAVSVRCNLLEHKFNTRERVSVDQI